MNLLLLCSSDTLTVEGATGFDLEIDGEPVALLVLRSADEVRVFHNICPHAGRRLEVAPGRFIIDAGMVICAAHGACFTIPAGECVAGPCRGQSLREVRCEMRDGGLWIDPPK